MKQHCVWCLMHYLSPNAYDYLGSFCRLTKLFQTFIGLLPQATHFYCQNMFFRTLQKTLQLVKDFKINQTKGYMFITLLNQLCDLKPLSVCFVTVCVCVFIFYFALTIVGWLFLFSFLLPLTEKRRVTFESKLVIQTTALLHACAHLHVFLYTTVRFMSVMSVSLMARSTEDI